ncbi:MAG: adenylyltransferase/cytidyltransferase family protein [Candidatus Izemoplasmatales bacterium]|nr:adenylyltransferase/cytidyltransferase family protein [Candidatus Izemoplasmatales bacterium]
MITGYAYVVADLFHIGHLKHLQRCKENCDHLIVGVLTDRATMEKKPRPIIPFEERIALIENVRCVDEAVRQETYSPLPNAMELDVDILFESTSHAPDAIGEAQKVMSEIGGQVIVMPYYDGQSSTDIKKKIVREWKR